jgi:hypothetical protein
MFFAPRVAQRRQDSRRVSLTLISEKMKQGSIASRQPGLRRLNSVRPLDAPSILIEPCRQQEHSHLSNKNMKDAAACGKV